MPHYREQSVCGFIANLVLLILVSGAGELSDDAVLEAGLPGRLASEGFECVGHNAKLTSGRKPKSCDNWGRF